MSSYYVAYLWASLSPRARLMARPGTQVRCSHTRYGPMGCPISSTSLHSCSFSTEERSWPQCHSTLGTRQVSAAAAFAACWDSTSHRWLLGSYRSPP